MASPRIVQAESVSGTIAAGASPTASLEIGPDLLAKPRPRYLLAFAGVLGACWVAREVWLRLHPPTVPIAWSGAWSAEGRIVCIDPEAPAFEAYRSLGGGDAAWGGAIVDVAPTRFTVSVLLVHMPVEIQTSGDSALIIDGRLHRRLSPTCSYGRHPNPN